jgi:hypothetical protein
MINSLEGFSTTFLKRQNVFTHASHKYLIEQSQIINRGGREGEKFFIGIRNPLLSDNNEQNMWFVAKKYELNEQDKLFHVMEANLQAKKYGLPVPNTVRYFRENENLYLLMSDQTSHGKFLIWGYNSLVSDEKKLFAEVNVTGKVLNDTIRLAENITTMSTQHGAHIKSWNYHIRFNIQTSQHDIVLLDLIPDMFTHLYSKKKLNNANKQSLYDFSKRISRLANMG